MYSTTATHAQFEVKWAKLMTLAGQLERSPQIPLPALLVVLGCEIQTTLDQCECLTYRSLKLEGKREIVAALVIGNDLAMAQNQSKLIAV